MRKARFLSVMYFLIFGLCLALFSCSSGSDGLCKANYLVSGNLNGSRKVMVRHLFEGVSISFPWIANVGQLGNDEIKYYAYTDFGAVAVTTDSIYYYFFLGFYGGYPQKIYVLKETFPGARDFKFKAISTSLNDSGEVASIVRDFNLSYYTPQGFFKNIPVFKSLNLGELWEGVHIVLDIEGARLVKKILVDTPDALKKIKIRYGGVKKLVCVGDNTISLETFTKNLSIKERVYLYLDNKAVGEGTDFYRISLKDIKIRLPQNVPWQRLEIAWVFQKLDYTDTGKFEEKCSLSIVDEKVYAAWDVNSIPFITKAIMKEGEHSLNELTKNNNIGIKDLAVASIDRNLSKVESCLVVSGSDDEFVGKIGVSSDGHLYLSGTTFSRDFPLKPALVLGEFDYGKSEAKDFLLLLGKDLTGVSAVLFAKRVADFTFNRSGEVILSDDENLWLVSTTLSEVEKVFELSKYGFIGVVKVIKVVPNQGILIGGYSSPERLKSIPGIVVYKGKKGSQYEVEGENSENYVPYDDSDAFIGLVDLTFSSLKKILLIGGSDSDKITDVAVLDEQGNVVVGGITFSLDFPYGGPVSSERRVSGANVFLIVLNSDLERAGKGVLLGGTDNDELADIEVDKYGFVYITGITLSPDFPVPSGGFRVFPYIDKGTKWDPHAPVYPTEVYVLKLDKALQIVGGTFLGGSDNDYACDMDIVTGKYLLLIGYSESRVSAFQEQGTKRWGLGSFNVFLSKLDCDLSKVYGPE